MNLPPGSSLDQLSTWMEAREDEHLEFKEARANFEFETLVRYCAALANEGGGRIILGVTDRRPRRVVGTLAFEQLERTKAGLVERLRLRVDAEEVQHPGGRVLVFHVPSRPLGVPVQCKGAYWMRAGEDLVPMTPDLLRRIFAETGPDFSAEVCGDASTSDLDPAAVDRFRAMWRRKSGNAVLETISTEQLLADAELVVEGVSPTPGLFYLGHGRLSASTSLRPRSSSSTVLRRPRAQHSSGSSTATPSSWYSMTCGTPSIFGTTCSTSKMGSSSGISRLSTRRQSARRS